MEKLTYIFDIDGTICNFTDGHYDLCKPFKPRIEAVNRLFLDGHTVIYATSRGMGSTNGDQKKAIQKYYDFTKKQLEKWGCLYHRLYLGKPKGDIYIDDRGLSDTEFFNRSSVKMLLNKEKNEQ